eukprot:s233_g35.t1
MCCPVPRSSEWHLVTRDHLAPKMAPQVEQRSCIQCHVEDTPSRVTDVAEAMETEMKKSEGHSRHSRHSRHGRLGPEGPKGEGQTALQSSPARNARNARSAPAFDDLDADDVQLWDSNSWLSFSFSYVRYVNIVNPVSQSFPKRQQIPLQRLPLSLKFAGSASISCHLLCLRVADTKVLDPSL